MGAIIKIIILGIFVVVSIALLSVALGYVTNSIYSFIKESDFKLPWKSKSPDDVLWSLNAFDATIIADKLMRVRFKNKQPTNYSSNEYGAQGIINILNEYNCRNFNYCHVYLIEYLLKDSFLPDKDKRLYWIVYALLEDDESEYNDRFSTFNTAGRMFSRYSKKNISKHAEEKRIGKFQDDVIAISKIMNSDNPYYPDSIIDKIESVSSKIMKFNENGDINELNSLNNSAIELLHIYNKMTRTQKNVFMVNILNQLDTIDISIDRIVNNLKIEGSDAHFENQLKINERYLSNFE